MGIAAPRIAVSGLNPHAGEGGLFGREEIDIIKPAIDAAAAQGLTIAGPFGADTMFHMPGFDAFVVMLHDQGHIAAKVMAEHAAAALAIGTPILFSSVAHGSAHDIAGKGVADPKAMIEAVLRMASGAQSVIASTTNVILGSAAALLLWTLIGLAVARAVLPQRALHVAARTRARLGGA